MPEISRFYGIVIKYITTIISLRIFTLNMATIKL